MLVASTSEKRALSRSSVILRLSEIKEIFLSPVSGFDNISEKQKVDFSK